MTQIVMINHDNLNHHKNQRSFLINLKTKNQ